MEIGHIVYNGVVIETELNYRTRTRNGDKAI
jgi:hypothetical protein